MARLLVLANELLEMILDLLGPNDFESFVYSCKRIRNVAGDHRLAEHSIHKLNMTRVENGWGSGLLDLLRISLRAPRLAEYVKSLVIKPRKTFWNSVRDPNVPFQFYGQEISDPNMQAFVEVVEEDKTIPLDEKVWWVLRTKAGDENPVVALLFLQMQCLTKLVIVLDQHEDIFMLKTVHRIVQDPSSPSLSQLREVEILGTNWPVHEFSLLTVFTALPSVKSLKGRGLVQESHTRNVRGLVERSRTYTKLDFAPVARSSNLESLTLEDCTLCLPGLFNLINSAKSLRSFTYTPLENYHPFTQSGTLPSATSVREALLRYTSTSLVDLTLRRSDLLPDSLNDCSFKSFQNLRTLTIDCSLLIGNGNDLMDKIATALPEALEVLSLLGCQTFDSVLVKELVDWVIRKRGGQLSCLKELHLMELLGLHLQYSVEDLSHLCTAATRAGFKLKLVPGQEFIPSTIHRDPREWNNVYGFGDWRR